MLKRVVTERDTLIPPKGTRRLSEKFRGYSTAERMRTKHLLNGDPTLLRKSLRFWLNALFVTGPCSTKRLNILLYCQRAIKTQEFAQAFGGAD